MKPENRRRTLDEVICVTVLVGLLLQRRIALPAHKEGNPSANIFTVRYQLEKDAQIVPITCSTNNAQIVANRAK